MAINTVNDLGGFGQLAQTLLAKRQMDAAEADRAARMDLANRQFAQSQAQTALENQLAERQLASQEAQRELQRRIAEGQFADLERKRATDEANRGVSRGLASFLSTGQEVLPADFVGPPVTQRVERESALRALAGLVAQTPNADMGGFTDAQRIIETAFPAKYTMGADGSTSPTGSAKLAGSQVFIGPDGKPKLLVAKLLADGSVGTETVDIPGELASKLGETAKSETERKVGEAGRVAAAKASAERAVNPEDVEKKRLEIQREKEQREVDLTSAIGKGRELLDAIDRITGNEDVVDALTGLRGRMPTVLPSGVDADALFEQMTGLLTIENLGIMKGVLSDSDIKMIKAASSGLKPGMKKETFLSRMVALRNRVASALEQKMGKMQQPQTQAPQPTAPATGGIRVLRIREK